MGQVGDLKHFRRYAKNGISRFMKRNASNYTQNERGVRYSITLVRNIKFLLTGHTVTR